MRYYPMLLILILFSFSISAQSLTPTQILEKSIEYHDPDGRLFVKALHLSLRETRPNGADRESSLMINIRKENFVLISQSEENTIKREYKKGEVFHSINGNSELTKEDRDKFRLTTERTVMLKNYYQYLWLLPLKLKDEGTNFNPLVKKVDFFGKESLEIRVTYDPGVGGDVWYFYFHPKTFALQGYRFYHNEEKNDGEYIILDGEIQFKNVKLPKERKWYTHQDDKFLGADILEKISF